jgi:hypothetical protein
VAATCPNDRGCGRSGLALGVVGFVHGAAPLLVRFAGWCCRRFRGREPIGDCLVQLREVAQGFGGLARMLGVMRRVSAQVPRIVVGRPCARVCDERIVCGRVGFVLGGVGAVLGGKRAVVGAFVENDRLLRSDGACARAAGTRSRNPTPHANRATRAAIRERSMTASCARIARYACDARRLCKYAATAVAAMTSSSVCRASARCGLLRACGMISRWAAT